MMKEEPRTKFKEPNKFQIQRTKFQKQKKSTQQPDEGLGQKTND